MDEQTATAPTVAPAPPALRRKIASRLILLALVAGAVAGGWFVYRSRPVRAHPQESVSKVVSVLHLENFVVNLADKDSRSFLRIGIDLGLGMALKSEKEAPPIALIRDTIFGVLCSWKADDLVTADGKAKLKQDLLRALNDRVPELGVREIYFTEFLVQR